MSSRGDALKRRRSVRRHQREKRQRDYLFQIADFDPWIYNLGYPAYCYFCRACPHTDRCLWVELHEFAKRSQAFPEMT